MKKRLNKSKEELVGTIEQNQKNTKLQGIVRDKVFPSLLENCKTVQEAEVVLEVLNTVMMQRMLIVAKELPFTALELEKFVSAVPEAEKYKAFFGIFNDLAVGESMDICGQLKTGVHNFVEAKALECPLSDVEIDKILG